MFNWPAYPFLRITITFIVGILLANLLGSTFSELHYIVFSLATLCIVTALQIYYPKKLNHIKGLGLLITIMVFAGFRLQSYSKAETKQRSKDLFEHTQGLTASIVSYPSKGDKFYTYDALTRQLLLRDTTLYEEQKIKIYSNREDATPPFQYGDIVLLSGKPFEIQSSKNPDAFDYSKYMSYSNIYFQIFVSPDKSSILKPHSRKHITEAVFRLRSYFESIIKTSIKEPKNQAIALALLLGIKDQLDADTKKSYATAGAMHVLAVSGLHIGIIHFIITFLFKPFRSRAFKKYALPIISLILLWTYAMLTGFSPSILRASTMFSIVVIGRSLNRSANIYNSIALSAFVLLLIKPTHLFSVGFQLSYLAVLGIVYLHPRFKKIYTPQTWLGHQIWSTLSVSLAAQLITTPISLLYFHQFPTYFLISNLIIILAASLIMTLGIALISTSHFMISNWIGWFLNQTIQATNRVVDFIQNLPYSLIDWVYISPLETVLVYTFIIAILFLEHSRNKIWYKYAYVSIMLIMMSKIWRTHVQSQKNQIIMYDISKQVVIDRIQGLQASIFSLDSIRNQTYFSQQINAQRLKNNLKPASHTLALEPAYHLSDSSLYFKVLNNKKFLFALKEPTWDHVTSKIKTDYLIIEHNAYQSVKALRTNFDFKTLVVAASNNYKTTATLRKQAKQLNIPIVLLKEEVLIIDIKD